MVAICLTAAAAGTAQAQAGGEAALDLETFQSALAPYGEWMALAPYGEVWQPVGVPAEWRPYFYGEWTWTDDGWFWESDEPWGWATYHFGRWFFDATWGWLWVPDYQWAPAWVAWRFGDGYVGWAPLYPGAFPWWVEYPVPVTYWCFVPVASFVGVPVHGVVVPAPTAREIFGRTRPAPPPGRRTAPAPPFGGPSRPAIESALGRPVIPARVVPAPTPQAARFGRQEGAVTAYRPRGAAAPPARTGPARAGPVPAPRAEPPAPAPRGPPPAPPARPPSRGGEERGGR